MKRNQECATFALLLAVGLSAAACSKKVGDSCQTAADCNPNGGRICDLSQPGGYCTILGCDETTCPSEATCVRYFPVQFLTKPCNPFCEDRRCQSAGDAGVDGGNPNLDGGLPPCPMTCPQDSTEGPSDCCPQGPTNDCTADEICLDVGLCAPRSSEMRFCALVCGSSGDCRDGYVCRPTGTQGSMALSATPGTQTSFCSPATQTQ